MRYMIVTYDETGLPTKDYSLFDVLGRFLTEEGLNCTLADMHAPSEVMDHVAPSRSLLEKLLTSVGIVADEMVYYDLEASRQAIDDELATMRALIEDELSPPYDEANTIPYLIPPAHQETPIVIVGEEPCEKVNS